MEKAKKIILIVMPILIFIIGFTIAFYQSNYSINNDSNTAIYETSFIQNCDPPEEWWQGDTYTCEISGINNGNTDVALRIIVFPQWFYADSTSTLSPTFTYSIYDEENDEYKDVTEDYAIINYINTDDWIDGGNIEVDNNNGNSTTEYGKVYYYKNKLSKNESTSLLTDKVTYNINSTKNNCDTFASGTNSYDNESAGRISRYNIQGCNYNTRYYGTFKLKFIIQTVQYNAYQSVWETDVEIN